MRVTIERANLLKSLNHVHRVVERRNTIPILSNVLIRAEGAILAMKATDLDLEINESTAAMVEQAGATTVPAHLLYEIVRKLPEGGEVMLATNPDGTLTYAFVESVKATYPYWTIRFLGGLMFLTGMLLMAWNIWKTIAGAKAYDAPVLAPAGQHA